MRFVLAALFVGITILASVSTILGDVQARRVEDQAAADKVGTAFVWPDAGAAADPDLTFSTLVDAAQATHSNVIRTSVGVGEGGRTQITHYLLLNQSATRMFDGFRLRYGRWLTPAETKTGRAEVTNAGDLSAIPVVGTPSVLADGYDLTFLGMRSAFETLPAAGQYVIESPDINATNRFLRIVVDRLSRAGLSGLSVDDLRPHASGESPDSETNLDLIAYLLVIVAALLVIYLFLRDGRRVGVLRLNGYSIGRTWFQVVGRLQLIVSGSAFIVCIGASIAVPGMDSRSLLPLLRALTGFTAATLASTFIASVIVVTGVRIVHLVKGVPLAGKAAVGSLLLAGTLSGIVLATNLTQLWAQSSMLDTQEHLAAAWSGNREYAVFYPRLVGKDQVELTSGGNASTIAEARGLYPVLDSRGALFVESSPYETGQNMQSSDAPIPPPLRVNGNYLARYPILDETGKPISVEPTEEDWVVAVPAQYKAKAPLIESLLQASRTGSKLREGAFQVEDKIVGSPPAYFRNQRVRIIWTASGQHVFSFNQNVNPGGGNMITDPVIEIMTPANSLPVDRFNAITGSIGTALKVRVDGDPARTLENMQPVLRKLRLDDNLRFLVTPDEAALASLSDLRQSIAQVAALGGVAAIAVLGFAAGLTTMLADRLRRTYAIRRLHGFGIARANRELLAILSAMWAVQAIIIVGLHWWASTPDGTGANTETSAHTVLIIALLGAIQALTVTVTVSIVDRRSVVTGAKDL